MTESDLGAMLCEAFPYAFPKLLIFRRNIVNTQSVDGYRARAGVKGQADYYIMGARIHVEVETKSASHKWYREQIQWRSRCQALGIPYLVARALPHEPPGDTVSRWLAEIRALIGDPPCSATTTTQSPSSSATRS